MRFSYKLRLPSLWTWFLACLVLLTFSGLAQAQRKEEFAPPENLGPISATSSSGVPIRAKRANIESSDYLGNLELPKGQVQIIQAASEGPIPVFVHVSNPKQADFLPCLYWSFDRWTAVTDGRVRFKVVSQLNQAKISILIQPGMTFAYDGTLSGDTKYSMKTTGPTIYPLLMAPLIPLLRKEKMDLSITVNTGPANTTEPLLSRQRRISAVMLHELGHALGLWGHSPDPADIMYPTTSSLDLTQRDIRTIRRLYGLPSQNI
jgi:hypothetical protein